MTSEFDEIARAAKEAASALTAFDAAQLAQDRLTPGVMALQSDLATLEALAGIDNKPSDLTWLQEINCDPNLSSSARRVAKLLDRQGNGDVLLKNVAGVLGIRVRAVVAALAALEEWAYIEQTPSIRVSCVKVRLLRT